MKSGVEEILSQDPEPEIDRFAQSRKLKERAHRVIPGGCHTYAKGDDQYPVDAPGFIRQGRGCYVWDVDGNRFIEYGMGMRAVTLGHGFPSVVKAAQVQMEFGSNFTRPSQLETEAAESLLSMVPSGEMVKFAKDGSTVTTAAIKLARAATGRDMIAICADDPFLSYNDWFISTTPMDRGIPKAVTSLQTTFRYNDFESVEKMFAAHKGNIACVILEPARTDEPVDDFLHLLQDKCRSEGTLFVLDEMITGFRWANGGGQEVYDLDPDLSAFGKAMANGFSQSALVGKERYMRSGGLGHDEERVFLLSTTHGAESHSLAAAIESMRVYREEPVIDHLYAMGARLKEGVERHVANLDLKDYFKVVGRPSNLVFATLDSDKSPSQPFRTLFMQEIIKRGILAPSFVISYSHSEEDVDTTIGAVGEALVVYKQALESGVDEYLVGRSVQPVFRKFS